jgi:hypothetical protein
VNERLKKLHHGIGIIKDLKFLRGTFKYFILNPDLWISNVFNICSHFQRAVIPFYLANMGVQELSLATANGSDNSQLRSQLRLLYCIPRRIISQKALSSWRIKRGKGRIVQPAAQSTTCSVLVLLRLRAARAREGLLIALAAQRRGASGVVIAGRGLMVGAYQCTGMTADGCAACVAQQPSHAITQSPIT